MRTTVSICCQGGLAWSINTRLQKWNLRGANKQKICKFRRIWRNMTIKELTSSNSMKAYWRDCCDRRSRITWTETLYLEKKVEVDRYPVRFRPYLALDNLSKPTEDDLQVLVCSHGVQLTHEQHIVGRRFVSMTQVSDLEDGAIWTDSADESHRQPTYHLQNLSLFSHIALLDLFCHFFSGFSFVVINILVKSDLIRLKICNFTSFQFFFNLLSTFDAFEAKRTSSKSKRATSRLRWRFYEKDKQLSVQGKCSITFFDIFQIHLLKKVKGPWDFVKILLFKKKSLKSILKGTGAEIFSAKRRYRAMHS